MLQITTEFKKKVVSELLTQRQNYEGSDSAFAKIWGINAAVFSRLKAGEVDGILKDSHFLTIGRALNVDNVTRKWKAARTEVFTMIEEDIDFCQTYSKARIFVDECDIGKSFAAKYIARSRKNAFYLDASECKSRQLFIRTLAQKIGIDHNGKYATVKGNLKYYLKMLQNPIVIIDEAGDLEYPAFLELKELWNGTENACGWYMIGADGLKEKIERGIRGKKVGYREIFRRFSGKYSTCTPQGRADREAFFKRLIGDVLGANLGDKTKHNLILSKCLVKTDDDLFAGLTRAESLIILEDAA
ncbi:MAG: ATP-binding protein [Sphingobacteriales bacterium]|nr:ATP-binding protein [Sphingobacteriales bacterium]